MTCLLNIHLDLFAGRLDDVGYLTSVCSDVLAGKLDNVASKKGGVPHFPVHFHLIFLITKSPFVLYKAFQSAIIVPPEFAESHLKIRSHLEAPSLSGVRTSSSVNI